MAGPKQSVHNRCKGIPSPPLSSSFWGRLHSGLRGIGSCSVEYGGAAVHTEVGLGEEEGGCGWKPGGGDLYSSHDEKP